MEMSTPPLHTEGMAPRDSVDEHVRRWQAELPDLDPQVEGAVTRMQKLVRHWRQARQATYAALGIQAYEFDTLHALVAQGAPYRAGPSQLAAQLMMSPAAMTGRLDALEQRGWLRRLPSPGDRRKVVVELTEAGRATWDDAMAQLGAEEDQVLDALSPAERRQLADLLRRLLLRVERA
jgi:DNA-binding MarR family transcriptional regulator